MLKFKDSEGKVVGKLKDDDTEPTFDSEKKIKDTKEPDNKETQE